MDAVETALSEYIPRCRQIPNRREWKAKAYCISIYDTAMISSFNDAVTERIFNGLRSRRFEAIAKTAYRKLAILHSSRTLMFSSHASSE